MRSRRSPPSARSGCACSRRTGSEEAAAMPDVSFVNLLAISAIALLAPLLVGFAPRLRIPSVVLEIVAGVVVGPSVLGWVHVDLPVQILAVVGLAFLLFLAGLEIDLARLKGRLIPVAPLGDLVTLGQGPAERRPGPVPRL